METLRNKSKRLFASNENTIENINCGSLQRIADATEIMATNYKKLQSDLDWYKRRCSELREELISAIKSRNTYKGLYNKLKKL